MTDRVKILGCIATSINREIFITSTKRYAIVYTERFGNKLWYIAFFQDDCKNIIAHKVSEKYYSVMSGESLSPNLINLSWVCAFADRQSLIPCGHSVNIFWVEWMAGGLETLLLWRKCSIVVIKTRSLIIYSHPLSVSLDLITTMRMGVTFRRGCETLGTKRTALGGPGR